MQLVPEDPAEAAASPVRPPLLLVLLPPSREVSVAGVVLAAAASHPDVAVSLRASATRFVSGARRRAAAPLRITAVATLDGTLEDVAMQKSEQDGYMCC